MSVSSVGSTATSSSTAALQQQLEADQKTLSEAEAKKDSQTTLTSDEAKVTADEQAIANAATSHANPAEKTDSARSPAPTTTAAAETVTNVSTTGGLDISV